MYFKNNKTNQKKITWQIDEAGIIPSGNCKRTNRPYKQYGYVKLSDTESPATTKRINFQFESGHEGIQNTSIDNFNKLIEVSDQKHLFLQEKWHDKDTWKKIFHTKLKFTLTYKMKKSDTGKEYLVIDKAESVNMVPF